MEEITKEIGIGKGSFYYYYDSKELLFYDVVKHCEQNMIAELSKIQNVDSLFDSEIKGAVFAVDLYDNSKEKLD